MGLPVLAYSGTVLDHRGSVWVPFVYFRLPPSSVSSAARFVPNPLFSAAAFACPRNTLSHLLKGFYRLLEFLHTRLKTSHRHSSAVPGGGGGAGGGHGTAAGVVGGAWDGLECGIESWSIRHLAGRVELGAAGMSVGSVV